jgi:hypothetical protein
VSFPHSLLSPLHPLPPRATALVDHIVVVMVMKRSFTYLLSRHPTVDARPIELSYPDEQNNLPLWHACLRGS